MDCSLPGFSVHGILQTRILESGLPFPSPGDLPYLPRDRTGISYIGTQIPLSLSYLGSPRWDGNVPS